MTDGANKPGKQVEEQAPDETKLGDLEMTDERAADVKGGHHPATGWNQVRNIEGP